MLCERAISEVEDSTPRTILATELSQTLSDNGDFERAERVLEEYAGDLENANPYARARIHWSLALSQLSKFNEIVVNSTFMQDQVLNLGIPSSRLIIIPNGINIDDYVKFKHSNKNSDRIVCPNKVFYPKKGQDLLIRAFAESNCRKVSKLYLIGQGETKFKKYLSKRELMNVIRNSSFCVFPSLYEGFGITILEAMACGKPIISTCFGGPNDFIIDGKNGLLVNPRDIKSMSVALDSLAISLVKRSEIGRQASLTAREFSWKTISQKYISVYNRVLDTT